MQYKVDYESLSDLYSGIKSDANTWLRELATVKKRYNALLTSDSMSGRYADSLRKYLQSTHGVILPMLESMVTLLRDNCLLYKQEYKQQIDSNISAVITSSDLQERSGELQLKKRQIVALVNDVKDTLSQIQDIMTLRVGSATDVVAGCDEARQYIEKLDKKICALEKKHARNDFESLHKSISTLQILIRELQRKSRSFKENFPVDTYMVSDAFKNMYSNSLAIQDELRDKDSDIQLALLAEESEIAVNAEEQDVDSGVKEMLDTLEAMIKKASGIAKLTGKKFNQDELTLTSDALKYINSLISVWTGGSRSQEEIVSDITDLIKTSASFEKGLYEFFEKILTPENAEKLNEKMGGMLPALSLISGICESADEAFKTGKVFIDENSTAFDKGSQVLKLGETFLSSLGKFAIVIYTAGDKAIRLTNSGTKVVNQILAQPRFVVSGATKSSVKNFTAALQITSSAFATIEGGIDRAGEVWNDDSYNTGEKVGTIGIHAGMSGLSDLVSGVTFGVVDIDAEEVSDSIDNKVEEFVNSDSWASNFVADESKCIVARFAVAVGEGGVILVEEAKEGVSNVCSVVSNGAVQVFKKITGL